MVKKYTKKELLGIGLGLIPEEKSEVTNLQEEVQNLKFAISNLQEQIKAQRYYLDLRTQVNQEHHARIYEELEKKDSNAIDTTDKAISELKSYLSDLRHLHKKNNDEVRDTTFE